MDNPLNWLSCIFNDWGNYEDRLVENTKVNNYTIDTAFTSDYGYETAIWKDDNEMIIVERYDTKEQSVDGHKKWCEFCKTNPKSVFSVQLDEECDF